MDRVPFLSPITSIRPAPRRNDVPVTTPERARQRIGGDYARDVLAQMATIVAAGTGAQRVVVWLRVRSELRAEAASDGSSAEPLPVDGHQLPTLPDTDFGAPVLCQGELLGAISIRMPRDEPLNLPLM
jgi:hypothetical protein